VATVSPGAYRRPGDLYAVVKVSVGQPPFKREVLSFHKTFDHAKEGADERQQENVKLFTVHYRPARII
jgi:hypothetical protein